MIVVRLLIAIALLLYASVAQAQTFTPGQWTQWGSGTYAGAAWTANGTTDQDGLGNVITGGVTLGAWLGLVDGNGAGNFIDWSQGGAWDTAKSQFVACCGGGHHGWVNFDLNVFDMPTGTWNPTTGPNGLAGGRPARSYSEFGRPVGSNYPNAQNLCTSQPAAPCLFIDVNNRYSDIAGVNSALGARVLPNWGHHLGGMVFMPSVARIFYGGGYAPHWSAGGEGLSGPGIWEWDPATQKWAIDFTGSDQFPDTNFNSPSCAVWDSKRNRVLMVTFGSNGFLIAYDPAAALGSRITRMSGSPQVNQVSYATCVYDSKRDYLRIYGQVGAASNGNAYYDFSTGATTPTLHALPTITGSFAWTGSVGMLYDPIADRDVIWNGGQDLYSLDPATFIGTHLTPGGANPGPVDATAPIPSVWGRFAYLPAYDIYAIIPQASTGGMYGFAPTRPPVLAFTDIVSGPKSGNTDTSQGQSSGVNGAIVTVWGFNLVGATFTINGAAPAATYYTGNATPPACGAANLYNGYHKLQCAILQVASTASSGAGTIVATAGGFTSNTLPFTTVSGHICFAASGGSATGACGTNGTFSAPYGSIQTMLDNMDRNDIGYVRNGLNATGGVNLPTPNTRFDHGTLSDPFMIVAYPGAASQVGDSTHAGFLNSFSGTGYGVVYSKFTVYGDSQNPALLLPDAARAVGNLVTSPLLNSSSGSAGIQGFGSNLFILGNELAAVASITAGNNLDHVIYLFGRRDGGSVFLESGREVGWNYLHDNFAFRGINLFNGSGTNSNPIAGHNIHDNAIVNQEGDGILFGRAVVGVNSATNNLLINTGMNAVGWGSGSGLTCIDFQMSEAPGTGAAVSHASTVVTVNNNTLLNCGRTTGGSDSGVGVLMFSNVAPAITNIFNNLSYQQSVSFAYAVGGPTPNIPSGTDVTKYATNLWMGAGSAPSWDTSPVNSNPQLVSAVSTYNLHLSGNSPAIGAGTNLTSGGLGLWDFDGIARPASGAWDIGADQFAGGNAAAAGGTVAKSITGKGTVSGKAVFQ